ncbi:putative crotonase-like domain protein [Acinetobacter phage Scuro]|nr:putative crotonase-like domain protein [Acinetobacter phage Scuro]
MNFWLLEPGALKQIESAIARGVSPTAEQLAEFNALYGDEDFPGARILTKAGPYAEINISGTLTKNPSWLARFFGGGNTAYSEIISALNEAERDPNISEITLSIDSPGGNTNGLVEVMDAIKSAKKPTKALVQGQAASAAYGIASQANKIVALNRGSIVGSIGVVGRASIDPEVVEVASSNAPKKRPDLTTEEGKDIMREALDQIEAIFIADIAAGRGVTVDKVKSDFGQGGIFLADNALKNGMIDEIEENTRESFAGVTLTQEAKTMDLKTLQAQHPDTYAEAVQAGVDQERDRIKAHLTMGEASGDMATAITACKDGSAMTESVRAAHFAAGMKKAQLGARAADDETTEAATGGASTPAANAPDAFEAALDAKLNMGK